MRILSLLFSILLVSSCSSRKWSELFSNSDDSSKRNKKLLKSFAVDEKILKKYEEKEKASKTVPRAEVKKLTKAPVQEKKVAPSPTPKIEKKVITKKSIMKKYPKNYPRPYRDLNEKSEELWSEIRPVVNIGEKIYIDINYMGISTGAIVVTTKPIIKMAGKDAYHFNARVKTSSFYSYLYELDDNIDSYVSKSEFLPLKYSLIQRESGQDVDDLQLFDHDKHETYFFYKRVTDEKTKKKNGTKYTPYKFADSLSVLFLIRALPFKVGYKTVLPIMNKGKLLLMNVEVQGVESLDSEIGTMETYKVKASTKYSGDTLKSGDMTFWFSTDPKRIFVKFKAKIKIGSISGDVAKYEVD